MNNEVKKEVEFTPLNSTSVTPKRASLITKQLYQINSRNFKYLNVFKNFMLGILAALIVQLTENLITNIWYQILVFYLLTGSVMAYVLTQFDRFINYMAGGSYE